MHSRTAMLSLVLVGILFSFPIIIVGQQNAKSRHALTNADIIRQAEVGDSDSEIISNINRHETVFDFDKKSMSALVSAGISTTVIRAMFDSALRNGARTKGEPPPPTPGSSTPPQAATPVLAPGSGTYPSAQSVTITDSTPGAAIYYTTDGSTPTPGSSKYNSPINVSATVTISAIAVATGFSTSSVNSASYTIAAVNVQNPGNNGTTPQTPTNPQTAEATRKAAIGSSVAAPNLTPPGSGRPVAPSAKSGGGTTMSLDWQAVSTHEVFKTGEYVFDVVGVNDIVYQYELTVTLNPAYSADNIAALANVMKGVAAPTPEGGRPTACATLQTDFDDANNKASPIQTGLAGLLPTKQADGKYPSVPLNQTLNQWDDVKSKVPAYVASLAALKGELANNNCTSDVAPDLVGKAAQLIVDYSGTVKPKLESIDTVANADHTLHGEGFLDRTRGGSVVVRELYAGTDTAASPRTFPLEATYSVVTASGGFLLTTLPARSYSSVNQPPATSTGSTTTVLGVNGNSSVRPALTALLNFHDPFQWALNKPNFGLAISAGPVIEVANGQADTSKLGFFGGVSIHLWKQLFLTPGVHVGEFADFPQGFTHAGQTIPANFGALAPSNRYTARFAFAITFRGSNPSSLLGTGGSQKPTTQPSSPTTPSGPKQ